MKTIKNFAAAAALVAGGALHADVAAAYTVEIAADYSAAGVADVSVKADLAPVTLGVGYVGPIDGTGVATGTVGYTRDGLAVSVDGTYNLDNQEIGAKGSVTYAGDVFNISLAGTYTSETGPAIEGTVTGEIDDLTIAGSAMYSEAGLSGQVQLGYEVDGFKLEANVALDRDLNPSGGLKVVLDF